MIEFAESHLLIAIFSMILIQGVAVINGEKYGGTFLLWLAGTVVGFFAFWALIIIVPQVI